MKALEKNGDVNQKWLNELLKAVKDIKHDYKKMGVDKEFNQEEITLIIYPDFTISRDDIVLIIECDIDKTMRQIMIEEYIGKNEKYIIADDIDFNFDNRDEVKSIELDYLVCYNL